MLKYVNIKVLNLRTGPSTNYYILQVLNLGEEVEVIQEGYNWTKIKCLGKIGFVESIYLSNEKMFVHNRKI